jgi:hypothetical protein
MNISNSTAFIKIAGVTLYASSLRPEKRANSLNEEEWGMRVVPRFQLIEHKEEAESDNIEITLKDQSA